MKGTGLGWNKIVEVIRGGGKEGRKERQVVEVKESVTFRKRRREIIQVNTFLKVGRENSSKLAFSY